MQYSESLTFSTAHIRLLVEGVMLRSIPVCSLRWNVPGIHCQKNKEIFKHLKQMQRFRSQSRLKDRITPMQMTQGPCNHYLMLLQSFQLFTTEDSRATWNNSLLDKLLSSPDQSMKQLEQMEEDNLCCSHLGFPAQEYFHGIHLYLREQEYSHFP
uniref:Uncharacterized protein n=1 Tax=Bos indicus x Bos taurus TaxID=30522 RepID=A0A4W2CWS2_BOBOX